MLDAIAAIERYLHRGKVGLEQDELLQVASTGGEDVNNAPDAASRRRARASTPLIPPT
jgi:hypothetical protein